MIKPTAPWNGRNGATTRAAISSGIGIAAISIYEPPWALGNDWFNGTLSRKFVQHTGIQSRRISLEDEVTMGVRAVESLHREVNCNLENCAAAVFVSPSFVPLSVVRKCLGDEHRVRQERTDLAARQFVGRLGIPAARAVGMNWFCSGYSKSLSIVCRRILPGLSLREDQFILVVTVSRISRVLDYGCTQTAPLFGDMAAVTLLARTDSRQYPVRFALVFAGAATQPTAGALSDFHLQEDVLVPAPGGQQGVDPQRLVFSLDGMGMGDAAPRAMADAVAKSLRVLKIRPEDVQFVVPHQAGTGLVRLAAMKLEEIGIRCEVINGMTSEVGNVSSCSIPYAIKRMWQRLDGTIVCPTAGVGPPGDARVSQGCVVLRAT
jgi:3-oxoacyl-[acyl-carrier-protein] synthase III